MAILSSVMPPRLFVGTLNASASRLSAPSPAAMIMRPFDRNERVATSRATAMGWRRGIIMTLGPNLRRWVRDAMAAIMGTMATSCRSPIMWSLSHTESTPQASALSMYSNSVAASGMPRYHRPSPMPILMPVIGFS